jgi:hypothetical protein
MVNKVTMAILALLDELPWRAKTPQEINGGDCPLFASDVLQRLGPDSSAEIVSSDERDKRHAVPFHVWIEFDGRHYDAEVPGGVDEWRDLPIYRRFAERFLRLAAKR